MGVETGSGIGWRKQHDQCGAMLASFNDTMKCSSWFARSTKLCHEPSFRNFFCARYFNLTTSNGLPGFRNRFYSQIWAPVLTRLLWSALEKFRRGWHIIGSKSSETASKSVTAIYVDDADLSRALTQKLFLDFWLRVSEVDTKPSLRPDPELFLFSRVNLRVQTFISAMNWAALLAMVSSISPITQIILEPWLKLAYNFQALSLGFQQKVVGLSVYHRIVISSSKVRA